MGTTMAFFHSGGKYPELNEMFSSSSRVHRFSLSSFVIISLWTLSLPIALLGSPLMLIFNSVMEMGRLSGWISLLSIASCMICLYSSVRPSFLSSFSIGQNWLSSVCAFSDGLVVSSPLLLVMGVVLW